jgi:S1-C subfamily serine protease
MGKVVKFIYVFSILFLIVGCTDYQEIYDSTLRSFNDSDFEELNLAFIELESGDLVLYDSLVVEFDSFLDEEVADFLAKDDLEGVNVFLNSVNSKIDHVSPIKIRELQNLITVYIEEEINVFLSSKEFEDAQQFIKLIDDEVDFISDSQIEEYDNEIAAKWILELVADEEYFTALSLIESKPASFRIEARNVSEFSREILEYLVAEVYVYYWDSSSISDLALIEEELEYIYSNLSEDEKYLLSYDMVDLQWHKGNYELNDIFIENYIKKLDPNNYEEILESNEEMRLTDEFPSASDLARYLEPRSAIVNVYNGTRKIGTGSAFFINNRGLLLTNYHVVDEGNRVEIVTSDGRTHEVRIVEYDEKRDLALLKASITGNDFVWLSNSYYVETGDTVYTYGSPLGITNTITEGIISKNLSIINGQEFLQLSAPISPGSSGGMLVNEYGEIIGVTTAYLRNGQNMNLAIPINRAINLIQGYDSNIELVAGGNRHITDITSSTIRKITKYIYENTSNDTLWGFVDDNNDYVYGIIEYKDGSRFEGELGSNRLGRGYIAYYNDEYYYHGLALDGQPDGTGTMYYSNGNFYVGQFSDGLRNGVGNFYWGSDNDTLFGHVYIGEFEEGYRNGLGTYLWPNGDIYEGDWVDGERNGEGKFYFTTGNVYEGDWVDGERTGYGIFYWLDNSVWHGDIYEGDFIDGVRTGYGTYYFPDGAVYEGDFVENELNGFGKYYFNNGVYHEGRFASGKPFGQGTRTYSNGIFIANWTDWGSAIGTYIFNSGGSEAATLRNYNWIN